MVEVEEGGEDEVGDAVDGAQQVDDDGVLGGQALAGLVLDLEELPCTGEGAKEEGMRVSSSSSKGSGHI